MNKGDLQISISSKILRDWKNNWTSETMQNIYEKFIIKQRLESYKTELFSKTYAFQDDLKARLNLQ